MSKDDDWFDPLEPLDRLLDDVASWVDRWDTALDPLFENIFDEPKSAAPEPPRTPQPDPFPDIEIILDQAARRAKEKPVFTEDDKRYAALAQDLIREADRGHVNNIRTLIAREGATIIDSGRANVIHALARAAVRAEEYETALDAYRHITTLTNKEKLVMGFLSYELGNNDHARIYFAHCGKRNAGRTLAELCMDEEDGRFNFLTANAALHPHYETSALANRFLGARAYNAGKAVVAVRRFRQAHRLSGELGDAVNELRARKQAGDDVSGALSTFYHEHNVEWSPEFLEDVLALEKIGEPSFSVDPEQLYQLTKR